MIQHFARIKQWYNRPKSKTAAVLQEVVVIVLLIFIIRAIQNWLNVILKNF